MIRVDTPMNGFHNPSRPNNWVGKILYLTKVSDQMLADKDKSKWHGKGVTKAVANINNVLAPELVKAGFDPVEQVKIDELMLKLDGTENKNNLGANAILGVSMAVCKAGAAHKGGYLKIIIQI